MAPSPSSEPMRTGLRWLVATSGGLCLTLLLLAGLAQRVRSAEVAVTAAIPVPVQPVCANSFVASGVRLLGVDAVVGHHGSSGSELEPIPGAALVELEGGTELDWQTVETPVTHSDAEGRLSFSWLRRFHDRYACGDLVESWQQASQLFVVRAPGCVERTLIVTPDWREEEIVLVCPGRVASAGGLRL